MAQRRLSAGFSIELYENIMGRLPPNEIACNVRLVNRALARHFLETQQNMVQLSQSVPQHAFWLRCETNARAWIRSLSLDRRLKLLSLTAASGNLANLQVAVKAAGCAPKREVMEAAAAAGHQHVCQWLRRRGFPWGWSLQRAAGAGQRRMCEWLLASGCAVDGEVVLAAIRGGHVGLVEWLRQHVPKDTLDRFGVRAVVAAAHGCDLPTLQLFCQALPALDQNEKQSILASAASSPTPDWQDKMIWLENRGWAKTAAACTAAAGMPDAVERLRWLRERGYSLDESAVAAAVRSGMAAAVQHLLEEEGLQLVMVPGLRACAVAAAWQGHLTTLQVLHGNGYNFGAGPCLARCLWNAAEGGHRAVVSWLVGTFGLGVEDLQANTAHPALLSGNMELLTWLAERGCHFDRLKLGWCGSEDAVEWHVARRQQAGRAMPADGDPYIEAARRGDLAALACLHRLSCPWAHGSVMLTYCIAFKPWLCPPLPVLRWLVSRGCPVDWDVAESAAAREVGQQNDTEGWTAAVAWLVKEGRRRRQRRQQNMATSQGGTVPSG